VPNVKTVTLQELTGLYAALDDEAAHHVLWVDHSGEIHIDPIPDNLTPVGFAAKIGSALKFRWETWVIGNGYVGTKAAKDRKYMEKQLAELKRDWARGVTGYVDY
jgi:hypothetical protein